MENSSGNFRGNIPKRGGEDITGFHLGETMVYCTGTEAKQKYQKEDL